MNNRGPGHEKLWRYFGLSYASWLTMPRAMMHEMPDEWQGKMAQLLDEWHQNFPDMPDVSTTVSIKKNNKFISMPALNNYKYPDRKLIESFKGDENKCTDTLLN